MGTALYFDYRSFQSLSDPIGKVDIEDLERIHVWITAAFVGLWITGITLIYIRTGFQLEAFSPKLWTKISIMVLMTLNSFMVGAFIRPMMRNNMMRPMISLPPMQFAVATQVAVVSLFCWSSGLLLGSSAALKTAPWDVLLVIFPIWFAVLTIGGHLTIVFVRRRALGHFAAPAE
ncbi:hypothetical protein MWU61_15270 [Loktanella sp. F6476L]|uniref:hypothetical protein n=1 Tax=Loktanella sp. F6476L TaxID=2926405 RepID=UPI001FF2121B|nr:hypothetical protein [Loktanella sp. F6476L]MCK0121911.1 hypothetical protein [Loktanella sp. F6476L]